MKKTRKGWMKIFEASISITLIMGFMVLVYTQSIQKPAEGESLLRWQESVLDEVKSDPMLRDAIINTPDKVCNPEEGGGIYDYIRDKIVKNFPGFGFSCRVCDIDHVCGPIDPPNYRPEMYSEERIIASTLTKFAPKKLKIFVWPLEPEEQIPENVPDACIPEWVTKTDWECINYQLTKTEEDTKCNQPDRPVTGADCGVAPLVISNLVCGFTNGALPISCSWINPPGTGFNINVKIDQSTPISLQEATSYSVSSITERGTPYLIKVYVNENESDAESYSCAYTEYLKNCAKQ